MDSAGAFAGGRYPSTGANGIAFGPTPSMMSPVTGPPISDLARTNGSGCSKSFRSLVARALAGTSPYWVRWKDSSFAASLAYETRWDGDTAVIEYSGPLPLRTSTCVASL